MTYYPYECYYGMKIDDGQLEFIKWVIRTGLESYAMEAMCEAWRGSEGDQKAANDLGPTLLESLANPESNQCITTVDVLGQLYRATQDQEIIDAIVASAEIHFPDENPGDYALEHYARNLQMIGGESAIAAARSFWNRIDETRLLQESFTRWFDQQWCKHGLTVESFLETLQSRGQAIGSTADSLYMTAWQEYNDRRQSAPSLNVYPQGYYESVVWGLDDTSFGKITDDDFDYVLESLQKLSEQEFSFDALQKTPDHVTFVFHNRLVQFESATRHMDVAEVVDFVNELMTSESTNKRFLLLPYSEDNQNCILYDTPDQLKSLASQFFLLHPESQQLSG